MRRRSFLELLMASPVLSQMALAQEVALPEPQRVLLTLSGIGAATDPAALGALLAALVAGGVPVNLVISTREAPDRLQQGSETARLILRYVESFPGLVEVVAWCPDLGQLPPYQAARQAQETRTTLYDVLQPGAGNDPLRQPLLSIACRAPLDSGAASAVLASGFRNVLELPETGSPVTARQDRLGVLTLLGGENHRIEGVAAALSQKVPGLQRHLVLSADDISQTPVETLLAAAGDIGRVLREATLSLTMLSVLANDLQMRTDTAFRRRVAVLVLETPGNAEPSLQQQLAGEGIGFSTASVPPDAVGGLPFWVPLDLPQGGAFNSDTAFGNFAQERITLARPDSIGGKDLRFGVVVRPVPGAEQAGLTPQAEFNIPLLAFVGTAGDALEGGFQLGPDGDGLLLVAASALQEPVARTAFLLTIRQIVSQAETRLMSLADYCAEALPKDPLLPTLLLTRSKSWRQRSEVYTNTADDRTALLEDAQAAWAFFDRNTNSNTGLSAVTSITGGDPGDAYSAVSMWEAGSHINAMIAAVDLGLIGDEEFTKRCQRLLRTLERASRKRLVLPPETMDAMTGKGTTRFNSYDTGRLMIALHRLNAHRLAPPGLNDLVASWDFSKVILDRRLHSWREQKMVDDFASNYADYAAAGMRLWGFDVASPFDDFAGLTSADDEARLLAATVSFGVLGAEPCFLHLLEMPGSPAAGYLADCLDLIQSRLAEATGVAAAPSESPLDRSPWFTYQGFDVSKLADPWVVLFTEKGAATSTQTDDRSLRATSTKAAYMWHALRPSTYSARLIETLRAKARRDYGFDSAFFTNSQMPAAGYSDLNTNAAILQSIAHALAAG